MYEIDWKEWEELRAFRETRKLESKTNLRNLMESDTEVVPIRLKHFIDMIEDDNHNLDCLDIMEEALMMIADDKGDPKDIAIEALKKVRGD